MADQRMIDEASNPSTQMSGFLKRKRESSQFAGSSVVAGNQPSSSTGLSLNACMFQDQSRPGIIGGSSNVARGPISNASCSSPDLDLLLPSDFDQVLSSVRRKPVNLQNQVPSNLSCGSSTNGTRGSSSNVPTLPANQDPLLLNDFNKVLSSVRQQRSSTQDQVPTRISTGSSAGWNDLTGYYQSDQFSAWNGNNVTNGQSSSGFNNNNNYYDDNNNNSYHNYNSNYNSVYDQPFQFQPTSSVSTHGMVTMPMSDPGQHCMLATGNVGGVQSTFHGAANRLHTLMGSSQNYIHSNAIPQPRPALPVAQQNISGTGVHPGSVTFGGKSSTKISTADHTTTKYIWSRDSIWKQASQWKCSTSTSIAERTTAVLQGSKFASGECQETDAGLDAISHRSPVPWNRGKEAARSGRWNHCAAGHQVVLRRKNEERSHETDQRSRRREKEE